MILRWLRRRPRPRDDMMFTRTRAALAVAAKRALEYPTPTKETKR